MIKDDEWNQSQKPLVWLCLQQPRVGLFSYFVGGYPDSALTPTPPPPHHHPKEVQNVEEVRSTIGPSLAAENFLAYDGWKILFLPAACILKMLRLLRGIQIRMPNMKNFLTPNLPHPIPKPVCWDQILQGVNFFSRPQVPYFSTGKHP